MLNSIKNFITRNIYPESTYSISEEDIKTNNNEINIEDDSVVEEYKDPYCSIKILQEPEIDSIKELCSKLGDKGFRFNLYIQENNHNQTKITDTFHKGNVKVVMFDEINNKFSNGEKDMSVYKDLNREYSSIDELKKEIKKYNKNPKYDDLKISSNNDYLYKSGGGSISIITKYGDILEVK